MEKNKKSPGQNKKKSYKVIVSKDGPYLVSGCLPLAKETIVSDKKGDSVGWKTGESYPDQESYALCRCGQSKNKPYCDRTHEKNGFEGRETASRKKYIDQAVKISGPGIDLTDVKELCASARFCHTEAGRVRDLVKVSDKPKSKETAIEEACRCPAGRLVVWDKKTGEPIEPHLEPSISLIEDPQKKVSGPIWLKGGIPLESSDGTKYEIRNRVTVCRCGKSSNKPYCDGSHISAHFKDDE